MGPKTRSMTKDKFSMFKENENLEIIRNTLDPIQKVLVCEPIYMPLWRYTLFHRYAGKFAPKILNSTWTDYGPQHTLFNEQYKVDCATPIPSNLSQSTIEIRIGSNKLLKIHLYYTTSKVLIQGKACRKWVDQEFESLRAIVHTLATCDSTGPKQLAITATCRQAPNTADKGAHLLELPSPSLATGNSPPLPPPVHYDLPPPSLATDKDNFPPLSPVHHYPPSPSLVTDNVDYNPLSPPILRDPSSPSLATDNVNLSLLPPPDHHEPPLSSPPLPSRPKHPHLSPPLQPNSANTFSEPPLSPSLPLPVSERLQTVPSRPRPRPLSRRLAKSHRGKFTFTQRPKQTLGLLTKLQRQLTTATRTISALQQEIHTLKDQLSQTTLHTEQNSQKISDSEARVRNSVKASMKEVTQQMASLQNTQENQHYQLKEISNKLQSFKDSQNNINNSTKKQIQTLNTVKDTHNSGGNQTDITANTAPLARTPQQQQQEYKAETSNRYAILSDNNTDSSTCPAVKHTPKYSSSVPLHTQIRKPPLLSQPSLTTHSHPRPSLSHQYTNTLYSPTNNPNRPLPTPLNTLLRMEIPENCDFLLLGDSVLRGVDERKMSGHARNISIPGLTVQHLCQWLTTRQPAPRIRRLACHVGINSCDKGPVTLAQWTKLIQLLKQVFPCATLQLSSIVPPAGRHPLREAASHSTANLRRSCIQEEIIFTDNTPSFLTKNGAPRKALYRDSLHPSSEGNRALALNIRFSTAHQSATPKDKQAEKLSLPNNTHPARPSYAEAVGGKGQVRKDHNQPKKSHPSSISDTQQLVNLLSEMLTTLRNKY